MNLDNLQKLFNCIKKTFIYTVDFTLKLLELAKRYGKKASQKNFINASESSQK